MALNFTTGIDDATHKNGPPETRAHLVLGVNYALLAVAVLVVSSRILVKAKLRKLVMEDSLIVASTVRYLSRAFTSFRRCTDTSWHSVRQCGTGGVDPPWYGSLWIAAVCPLY